MTEILLKRGTSTNFNSITLKSGEPAFVTDTGKLYISNGSTKVLINPINKPGGINITNLYTKTRVNDYGQVVEQGLLTSADIPTIPYTQVSGLGNVVTSNIGTSSGNVPALDSSGKLPVSTIPTVFTPTYYFATYVGNNGVLVSASQFVPLTTTASSGNYTIDSGVVTINDNGLYIIGYNITSSSLQMGTALSYSGGGNWTGTSVRTSTTAVPAYVTASAMIVRQITTAPEKYGIKNIGTTDISLLNGCGSLSIVRIK